MNNPTRAYQRQQQKWHVSRRRALVCNALHMAFSGCGVILVLGLLGAHASAWPWYVGDVLILSVCLVSFLLGWSQVRSGRRTITHQEILQAKKAHRQERQRVVVQGELLSPFSRMARSLYLGIAVLFGLFVSLTWHWYAAYGGHVSAEEFGTLIGMTALVGLMLLMFLTSFASKAYQRESAAELKRILQEGEFSSSELESSDN